MTASTFNIRVGYFHITDPDPYYDLGFSYTIEAETPLGDGTFYQAFSLREGEVCLDPDAFFANEHDINLLKFFLKEAVDPITGAGMIKHYIHFATSVSHALAKMCVDGCVEMYQVSINHALVAHKRGYVDFSSNELAFMQKVLTWRNTTNIEGFVYLVQSPTGYYKIGRTKNPNDRIKTFEIKLPFEVSYAAVIPSHDMYTLEKTLHEIYASKRVNGEWFELSDGDVAYLRALSQMAEETS